MKSCMRTILLALTMLAILLPQSFSAAAQAGVESSPEQRLPQVVDELNQMFRKLPGDEPDFMIWTSCTPTDVVFAMKTSIPTDPEELAGIREEAEQFEVKINCVSDFMLGDTEIDEKFHEMLQLAALTDRGFRLDYVDPKDPTNRVSMDISNEELKYAIDHLEDYKKQMEEVYSSDDIDDLLAFEGIDEDPDTAMAVMVEPDYEELLQSPQKFEFMMDNYNWHNEEIGSDNRIWLDSDLPKVVVSLVGDSELKAVTAEYAEDSEELSIFAKALVMALSENDIEEDFDLFDWKQFVFLCSYLDYDLEFQLKDSLDDSTPVIVPMSNGELWDLLDLF